MSTTQNESLQRIISELKNAKTDDVRLKFANELRDYVTTVSRELTGESFSKFMNDINRRIFELIHSNDMNDKMGGIMAIDRLVDFEGEENATKITRFANYLRNVLPGTDFQVVVLASKALGRLALCGGTLTAEFVEFEVKRALEWLQGDRYEMRRQASVLVLKELILNAPTILYSFVNQILDVIWVALKDPKPLIRECAAETLEASLEIILERDNSFKFQWYKKILEEIHKGLKQNQPETIHGSLLAFGSMLTKTGRYMDDHFKETSEMILRYKDNKDILVRKAVMNLMPTLATFKPNEFVSGYLHHVMNYLLSQLKKEKDRQIAFISIGKIALAVGSSMGPYLDSIILNIREGLQAKNRNKILSETNPIFQCTSMLTIAVGPALTKHMHELLDQMFSVGLNEAFCKALVDLAKNIPPLLPLIQERLLNLISNLLCGHPYKPPGAPDRPALTQLSNALREIQINELKDTEAFILALNTLGTFDFSNHSLNEIVRDVVVCYLEDDNPEIRKAAALTCGQVLVKDPIQYQSNSYSIQIVNEVLEKLLMVGIADPEPSIRQAVLISLDERFDHYLAQADNVRALFIALNDEGFSIRENAITIIGRLTNHNPAYVLPSLRKTLIQLLTELEYSFVSRTKEESAKLLAHLISASSRLVKPYVQPILKVLLTKLKDPSPAVATQVLAAVGELAQVGSPDMVHYVPDLMPVLIETIQDQSSSTKREAALITLGKLATNTGYVIEAYLKYPELLTVLMNILKTEQIVSIRRETIKVVGILGALDPYRHKMAVRVNFQANETNLVTPDTESTVVLRPSQNEDYYPTVAIQALMKILKDQSLSAHHTAVVQAFMYIFKTLGLKCVPFLPQIMPPFLNMMKTSPIGMLEFHFQQLSLLVSIVRQHIRHYLFDIFQLIQEYWNPLSSLQLTILSLVESIAVALDAEFKIYLPALLGHLLQILENDQSEKRLSSLKVLHCLTVFGNNLEEYLHLVLPAMIKLFEKSESPFAVRKLSIQTIGQLCKKINFSDHASRIVHPLARILQSSAVELKTTAMDTLCALVFQLTTDFIVFVPMIHKIMSKYKIQNQNYDLLISKLLKNEPLPQGLNTETEERLNERIVEEAPAIDMSGLKKLPVNQQHLRKAWETSQRSTKDDWTEWMRRLTVELLKESPSHALRACASLASVYQPLARELFKAAFISCWTELYDQFQDEFVRSLETALTSASIPPETLQTLLNLCEYMEHDEKPLPIDMKLLGLYASKCHAYAKALHYKELEYQQEQMPDTIEQLISINNQLQLNDAAVGVLQLASTSGGLKEGWYEKLQRWEDALIAYERKQIEDPLDLNVTLGRMRCLHALGEWERLSDLAQREWFSADLEMKRMIAPLAAGAEWGLGHWEQMEEYIGVMSDSQDFFFFKSILYIHRNQYREAGLMIERTRELLDVELKALVGESYSRAYGVIVRVQMLAELEEMIQYKQRQGVQEQIRRSWERRLKGCQRNVEVWQRVLKVRSLVLGPSEDLEMWIKYANLCRKSGRVGLSLKILSGLMSGGGSTGSSGSSGSGTGSSGTGSAVGIESGHPSVVYAYLKHIYSTGQKQEAYLQLKSLTQQLSHSLLTLKQQHSTEEEDHSQIEQYAKQQQILAKCFLKLGHWQYHLSIEGNTLNRDIEEILGNYQQSTRYDSEWYKAWHSYALANYEILSLYDSAKGGSTGGSSSTGSDLQLHYIVSSVQGFFKSIGLSRGNSLQDVLRLLTLWFKYGHHQDVYQSIADGFNTVNIDTWLQVIPQLIARIHAPSPQVRRLIHQLLGEIGKHHPQALVYSLTVASKSQNEQRKESALLMMDKMRSHSSLLIEQALLVSQELIRIAILWHEMWHEGLEEASRLYFGEKNIQQMFGILDPLHQLIQNGPETLREISFHQQFGRDLQEALEWGRKYKHTGAENDLHQAWDLYYHVFRRINKTLPQLTTLELQYVSPKLLEAKDLELAVPGTYQSGQPVVKIQSFDPQLTVITSKQRPRRLSIRGGDGRVYQYLLKGHEDLRQDERVMQLFGLVNTLLESDAETFKRHLSIQGYPVIPLSPNSGLIGWVPHCDTLHTLIRDYRETKKILLNVEHRLMLQMAPDYDHLTLMQKVEVFQYALEQTQGHDLQRVLWLKSRSSESWLDRRTNYTRSLAVMSMVGYILGLGDRHPSNLMVERYTGKVIHIDFGDCFEVAQQREKFPERIPFRLTRMLVQAMEVSGIEGSFRRTCENVMRVLREHKESLMAVLEAFIHDPLINWRLLGQPKDSVEEEREFLDQELGQSQILSRKLVDENEVLREEEFLKPEVLNQRALAVIQRVSNKLTGRDFGEFLEVEAQVGKLIEQAMAIENLCQCYIGWCPFW